MTIMHVYRYLQKRPTKMSLSIMIMINNDQIYPTNKSCQAYLEKNEFAEILKDYIKITVALKY